VHGDKVLPGVAYLEMARAAIDHARGTYKRGHRASAESASVLLSHIVWLQPVVAGPAGIELHINLQPQNNDEIGYEIYTLSGEVEKVVHAQGAAQLIESEAEPSLDVSALLAGCTQWLTSDQCYATYDSIGLSYGSGHRSVQQIGRGEDEHGRYVIAKLTCPSEIRATRDAYVLHPGVMDGALQASLGMLLGQTAAGGSMKPALPFALEQVKVLGASPEAGFAYIREASDSSAAMPKLDIQVCDESGRIRVVMKGLSSRVLETPARNAISTLLFEPHEVAMPWVPNAQSSLFSQRWVVVSELLSKDWLATDERMLVLSAASSSIAERYEAY
jgi:acyl transferase domain-containing protein